MQTYYEQIFNFTMIRSIRNTMMISLGSMESTTLGAYFCYLPKTNGTEATLVTASLGQHNHICCKRPTLSGFVAWSGHGI